MLRRYIILIIALFSLSLHTLAQSNTVKDKSTQDICALTNADQLYRSKAIQDSIADARERNDTIALNNFDKAFNKQDSINFATLKELIVTKGYPLNKDGHNSCVVQLSVVLIHWAKEYPEQFNSPEMVSIFKREVDNRRLSKYTLDMAIYFYVSYMPVNLEYLELINNARITYGLPAYTKDEYTGKARIDFDLQRMNEDVLALTK